MTNSKMAYDDADSLRRFISQMKGQRENSNLTTVSSSPTTQHDQIGDGHDLSLDTHTPDRERISKHDESEEAKTPPRATVTSQDHDHMTSPEAHPKPSPRISGLTAPHNTPKTAASSPRLTAADLHNQDVADAFSDYVNNMNGRPLSESIWAPGSARQKPSMLSGARTAKVLTPIKAVESNPAINDTFKRMSFKAADPDDSVGENLIGDRVTLSMFSKAPPSYVNNKFTLLADKVGKDEGVNFQATPQASSDEDFETSSPIDTDKKLQSKNIEASKKDFDTQAHTNTVKKENDPPSISKSYLPPHLRATQGSSKKSVSSTRAPAQDTNKTSSSESSKTSSSSDQNLASSKSTVKTETGLAYLEGFPREVTSKVINPSPVKNTVRGTMYDVESKVTISPAGAKTSTDTSSVSEDLEHKTFFNAWPKLEERSRPAAKVRKIIIKDLPGDSTATFVASLVYGGPIEEINIHSSAAGDLSAVIRFMDAGDCMKFYEETSNGLVYKKDAKGRELVLFVELSKDVDVVGGLLQNWIASGVTRCVRAVGVEADWGTDVLVKIAERKNRKVEKIVDGQNPGGARSVVFRFCKVEDAVQFKAALSRDEEWEHCNIHYAADPCATATGVHVEG